MTSTSPLEIGRRVIVDEAQALHLLAQSLGEEFSQAVETLRGSEQVIVSGLGKSGRIAEKIAASMTSTGTPALYMHPVEALHGDLGIVTERHSLLALSRSGNTEEMLRFVLHFRRLGGPVIAMTAGPHSRLAEAARHVLRLPDVPEAGPLGLAPTTSCALMLALGDALAMALLHARGFESKDFAQYHPEGALGRRLLLRAGDLMHTGDELPLVQGAQSFKDLLHEMSQKGLGLAVVVHADGRLLGTFTDGDLRRIWQRVDDPLRLSASEAHARSRRSPDDPPVPVSTVPPQRPAIDCLRVMRDAQITSLVVVDEQQRPIGVLRLMDLLRAGLG